MEYSINKLAKLAGISTRTLRYYDQLELLTPARTSSNGYRVYGQKEVDALQQILFYRELGVPLDEIKSIVLSSDFDSMAALEQHLASLLAKKEQLNQLIITVEKSIASMKGDITMSDKEKFEGLKEKMLRDNEEKYGEEIRAKYGEDTVKASNEKFKGMTAAQYEKTEKLSAALNDTLKAAFMQGDPGSALAQQVCAMHKEWLCCFWDSYTKQAHIGVAQMYIDDPRFTAYYDKIAVGCAEFLRDAVQIYCK